MSTLREAAQQALEALLAAWQHNPHWQTNEAITALRAALAQEEQEPVAWMYEGIRHDGTAHGPHLVWKPEYMDAMSANKGAKAVPLYTHPPRRESRELTKEDLAQNLQSRHDAALLLEERRQEVAQPRREWRNLTMQEINALPEIGGVMWRMGTAPAVLRAIRAVEAALKEKNQ